MCCRYALSRQNSSWVTSLLRCEVNQTLYTYIGWDPYGTLLSGDTSTLQSWNNCQLVLSMWWWCGVVHRPQNCDISNSLMKTQRIGWQFISERTPLLDWVTYIDQSGFLAPYLCTWTLHPGNFIPATNYADQMLSVDDGPRNVAIGHPKAAVSMSCLDGCWVIINTRLTYIGNISCQCGKNTPSVLLKIYILNWKSTRLNDWSCAAGFLYCGQC